MNAMINKTISECEICQKENNPKGVKSVTPSQVGGPYQKFEIDLIGPMSNRMYILTAIDMFTRHAAARVVADKSSERVLNALENILEEIGKPREILCDNGKEFTNQKIQNWCNERGINVKHGSPYTPTTTGAIERFNRTLMSKLRKMSEFGNQPWIKILQSAVRAYNISPSRAIGMAPLELVEALKMEEKDRETIMRKVKENMERYRKSYEKLTGNKEIEELKPGDKVWYKAGPQECGKLGPKWIHKGIIQSKSFKSVRIIGTSGKSIIVNQRNIKPVKGKQNREECCKS